MFALNGEISLELPSQEQPQKQQLKSDEKCGSSTFLPEQRRWHNPLNWKTTPEDGSFFIPYLERVPCRKDDVIFPEVRFSLFGHAFPSHLQLNVRATSYACFLTCLIQLFFKKRN